MKIRKITLLVAGLLLANVSRGQNEMSLWGAGGMSVLRYNSSIGHLSAGAGGAFGAGYTRFFNPHWGLSAGTEYAFYQRVIAVDRLSDAYETHDILGNKIIYHTSIENYREQQRLGMLNIPLSLLYQTGNDNKFYASAGFKLGLPIYGYYKSNPSVLTTSGYYPAYDQMEIWQNDLGYGTLPMNGSQTDLNFGVSLMGTVESGVKWNIGIGKNLYTGIYADYGLNNIQKGNFPVNGTDRGVYNLCNLLFRGTCLH
ncbi:hypothetical protein AGMMS4957_15860 [Bacteroidia bacterium]|nr:hypothetical protein AGMMS4957_15860 [Bacteroidia bacterium]